MSKPTFWKKFFWLGVHLAALGLVVATLGGFLGRLWWAFDLLAHFRVQYLAAGLLLLVVYALGKRQGWRILTAGLVLINLSLMLPLFVPIYTPETPPPFYRLFLSNVLTENPHHDLTRNLIVDSDADFVALLEVNQDWLDDLHLEDLGYLYAIEQPRRDNFGIALYSRYPLENAQIINFGSWELPSIAVDVKLDEYPVTLLISHPVPPKGESLFHQRNLQMDQLTAYAAQLDGAIILAGDLNATSWSPYFGEWLHTAHLRDSRRGFGVQPTWNGINRLFTIPIDHILISSGIQVHERDIGPDIGSDHRPVIMDFSISPLGD